MIEVADLRSGDRVLDLGCGVGAVGCLASTRIGETGHVTFIDSNLRATALSELNAKANGVRNFDVRAAAHLEGLPAAGFDVVLANPPYYANAEIARLFIGTARHVLAPGGRFYYVTRMPTATVPDVFELFGDCSVIENRGYSVITAGKPADE
jgi:16S rRNA (guanine1207-N2)-methyltransferase